MRKASEHKLHGKVVRLTRPRGREVRVEHRVGNHLRLRVVMGDVVWSLTLRGFEADDPRIAPLKSALEVARQTGECDRAANEAVGRIGRGAQCFATIRQAPRRPRRAGRSGAGHPATRPLPERVPIKPDGNPGDP